MIEAPGRMTEYGIANVRTSRRLAARRADDRRPDRRAALADVALIAHLGWATSSGSARSSM
jgi:hypothetical protein